MDRIDQQILALLREDGRTPYSSLAKEVNLTSAAVGQRVQKMVYDGTIKGFGVDIDHEKLGVSIQAILGLKLNFAKLDSFHQVLKNHKEIEYCYRVTGDDCIVMKVNLKDNKHLLRFIDEMSNYGTTKSSIILERLV